MPAAPPIIGDLERSLIHRRDPQGAWVTARPHEPSLIAGIVIACEEPHRVAGWWQAITGYGVHAQRHRGVVVLRPPGDHNGTAIAFDDQARADDHAVVYLRVPRAPGMAERITDLGGRVLEQSEDNMVVADPEGHTVELLLTDDQDAVTD